MLASGSLSTLSVPMSPLPSPLPWAVLGCWLLAILPDALAALDYGMAFGAATASSQGRPPTRGQWAGWRAGHSDGDGARAPRGGRPTRDATH